MSDKTEIAEGKQRIEELEQQVAEARVATAAAMRGVHVQTRYASRVQNVARTLMAPPDAFSAAMEAVIDADKAALEALAERTKKERKQ